MRSTPDRKSTRLNSSHSQISYAVFCLKKKEHTSELQSQSNLVCRLLLEKKKEKRHSSVPVIHGMSSCCYTDGVTVPERNDAQHIYTMFYYVLSYTRCDLS